MKKKKEKFHSQPVMNIIDSIDDTKVRIIKKEIGNDLFELQFNGKKYNSPFEDYFEMSIDILKDLHVTDLPVGIGIGLIFTDLNYLDSIIEFEIPDFSIYRESDGKCRVACELRFDPREGIDGNVIQIFRELKKGLILIHDEMNPIIDADELDCCMIYSIEVTGDTIEKIIKSAKVFNDSINEKIKEAANKIPRFLADVLGLDKSDTQLIHRKIS